MYQSKELILVCEESEHDTLEVITLKDKVVVAVDFNGWEDSTVHGRGEVQKLVTFLQNWLDEGEGGNGKRI